MQLLEAPQSLATASAPERSGHELGAHKKNIKTNIIISTNLQDEVINYALLLHRRLCELAELTTTETKTSVSVSVITVFTRSARQAGTLQ